MFPFISPAYAQSAGGGGLGDLFANGLFLPLLIIPIFYFLVFRPQQQKERERQDMLSKIRRGDSVVVGGGIVGKVNRVRDDDALIDVEIAKGTIVQVLRSAVTDVRAKGEPVKEGA